MLSIILNANSDDGSCSILSVNGCTDEMACNYNPNATSDNGSCYNNDLGCGCDNPAATDGYDCDGNCLNDSDGDLVCDEFEVVGCQDESAANYDASATDAGECDYLGCTDEMACNYDPNATTDNGSCYNNDLGCGCDNPPADSGYNCDGTCLNDSDGDLVCDEFEVVGCQDESVKLQCICD